MSAERNDYPYTRGSDIFWNYTRISEGGENTMIPARIVRLQLKSVLIEYEAKNGMRLQRHVSYDTIKPRTPDEY